MCGVVIIGHRLARSRVRLPAVPLLVSDMGQVVHTHLPLLPSSLIWYQGCPASGKVTVGWALQWVI